MPRNSIPNRWLNYTPIGKRVPGTRFIPFKVPLKETICRNLPEDQRFTLQHLVGKVDKIGMIIDLTNTDRFYNPAELEGMNIEYKKLNVKGKEVPASEIVKKFFDIVDEFVGKKENDRKRIGVHCTHGLNRTGYLVCRYMVDKMQITPDAAIKTFNEARGHCMERKAYVEGLKMTPEEAEKLKGEPNQHDVAKYLNAYRNSFNNGLFGQHHNNFNPNWNNQSGYHQHYRRPQQDLNSFDWRAQHLNAGSNRPQQDLNSFKWRIQHLNAGANYQSHPYHNAQHNASYHTGRQSHFHHGPGKMNYDHQPRSNNDSYCRKDYN